MLSVYIVAGIGVLIVVFTVFIVVVVCCVFNSE
jgi:hypothetical protein